MTPPGNVKITIEIEITDQQLKVLPHDIGKYLENAALEKLGEAIYLNSKSDRPTKEPF